jgi:hypothetical protein
VAAERGLHRNRSSPVPDGEKAVFLAGTSRVGKIRITDGDFTIVDELNIPGYDGECISRAEIRRVIKEMEGTRDDEATYLELLSGYVDKIGQSSLTIGNGVYTVMDDEGATTSDRGTTVSKIADERPGDVHSAPPDRCVDDIRDGLEPDDTARVSRNGSH